MTNSPQTDGIAKSSKPAPSTPTQARRLGQRHFGVDPRKYKHDAQASVFACKALTRLRFVLVWLTKVMLPNYHAVNDRG